MFSLATTAVATALLARAASATTVLAHFMVQNAYAYDIDQWETDIDAAQQIGIDGFALNWIPPNCEYGLDWMPERIDDAFAAAENKGFFMVHSFDMSYSSCDVYWNQTYMQDVISKYSGSSAAYRWNNNMLVTTYGGDQVDEYGNEFFQGLKDIMNNAGDPIVLSPALTKYSMAAQTDASGAASSLMSDYSAIDGYMNWQAWPLNVAANITCSADKALKGALTSNSKTGPYIMSISPWQYKDLNDGNALDSWVAYSDTLFPDRFNQLATDDFQPDIIELLTWNDFTESHYLRDLPSTDDSAKDYVELGDMGAYVLGQNHSPWRIIAKYYIAWWKNGSPPAITMDQVVFWHRVHPKGSTCAGGATTGVRNSEYPEDAVFAWALVKEKSTISMSVGSNQFWTFEADSSGPSMSNVPFPSYPDSVTPQVAILRNGETLHEGNSSMAISSYCSYTNFNPVVSLVGEGINSGV